MSAVYNTNRSRAGEIDWIVAEPVAHRGLHDKSRGILENTLSAVRVAVEEGYAIEVDLHPSRDGVPMVFHDLELKRLTGAPGTVRELTASELGRLRIGGADDFVPTLRQLLDLVDGRSGLVLELKGLAGRDDGFVGAVANSLSGYGGPVAVMSFNHWLLEEARRIAPRVSLGLTAEGDDKCYATHRDIAARVDVDFVSYKVDHLPCRFVSEFRQTGRPAISWTVRTPAQRAVSARHADQITFEGFNPRMPT